MACLGHAAELGWSGAPGSKPPPGWTIAATAEAAITFQDRAIEVSVPPNRQALAIAAVDLPDGSDERPMRLSALVSAMGSKAVAEYPALVALEWAGGSVFAVGLGDDPDTRGDQRRAWAVWNGKGLAGKTHSESDLALDASPAHLRIVLTARSITAYGSRDGWSWSRIASMSRTKLGAEGAPARVLVGRGYVRSGAAGLAADPPGDGKPKSCLYRFSDVSVEAGAADVPSSALRSYVKKDSFSDTVEALAAPGIPRHWRIRGPDEGRKAELPDVLPAGFATGDSWKEHTLDDTARFIQLGKLLPGANSQVRWAATEITTTEAGWTRFRFDGLRRCWLWVAGRLVATDREVSEAEIDRQSATVWLPAGTHQVVMAVRSNDGRAAATLRWEPGDPRSRIALLRRLAVDFTGDEQLADAPFEMARLWEGLGFAREAAAALAEAASAGDPDQVERALTERARLYHQLGDEDAATAETAILQKNWEAAAADPVAAARRTARLWQRLDVPERALGILAEALKLPGIDAQTRCGLVVERARLAAAQGDRSSVAAELRLAAEQLPPSDPARFDLLCAAVRNDPALPQAILDGLTKQATDAMRARQLAGLQAIRKDEPARIAARRLAAGFTGSALAMPAIELAEDLAAAKDESGALALYQTELSRRKLPAAADLGAARIALARAVLGELPAGVALLADAVKIGPAAARPLSWSANGPHALGDWSPHERPAFAIAKGAAAGPVSGKEWKPVAGDLWVNGAIDLTRLGGGDNAVIYLTTTIDSDAERRVTMSFGADDGLSIWLNGERLFSDRVQRGLVPDSIVVSLPLRAGPNVLVASVQNGGGGYGFQYRFRRDPWPASDLAGAIAVAGSDRVQSAQVLSDLAISLLSADRVEEAYAIARTVIACWPDRADLAGRVLTQPEWKLTPAALQEVVAWFDANLVDRRWDDQGARSWVLENVPARLVEAGLVEDALARLRRQALVELDPPAVAAAHLREADLWLGMGFPRRALAACQRARDAAPGDGAIDAQADRRRRLIRLSKGDQVQIATPFELASLLRTAERAIASDPARAAADLQQAVETGREAAIQLADGRMRGIAAFAAARLRSAGTAIAEAWTDRHGSRAVAAIKRLAGSDDPQALAQLASRWPLAPQAGDVLRQSATLWSARGAWQLALGTAQDALAAQGDNASGLVCAAHAAARCGDSAVLEALLQRLGKLGQSVPWDGKQIPADALAAVLRALLPPGSLPEPLPAGLIVRLPNFAPSMRPETIADGRAPTPAALLVGDALVVATPDEVAAIAPDGSLRWRLPDTRLAAAASAVAPGPAEASAVVQDNGLVVAAVRRSGLRRLVAVDAASGIQRWSSAEIPELSGMALASAPTVCSGRVWAWFADRSHGLVVCLDSTDGTLLWRTAFTGGPLRQPITNAGDLFQSGDAPAPLLRGRELFVSSDAGQIGSFDAVDGRLLWIHAYARTMVDAQTSRTALRRLMSRGRGEILADATRVYVAPRDTLGILAIERASGALAWSSELANVDELVALTPAGLLTIGPAVAMYDPATGQRRWRQALAGARPGRPAVGSDAAWVATSQGVIRISLADGSAKVGPTWAALGLPAAAATLVSDHERLLACADGLVAVLATGAVKAAEAALVRLPEAISGPAVPAGDAKPVALVPRWELPIGQVETLQVPSAGAPGEAYATAAGYLYRIDAANGRVLWSAPTSPLRLRSLTVDGGSVLVEGEGLLAVHDRASGRLRWQEAIDRDPAVHRNSWDNWRAMRRLDGDRVLSWTQRDMGFQVRSAIDGHDLLRSRADAPVFGVGLAGDEVHVVVARGNSLGIEVRRLADGVRIHDAALGIDGVEYASVVSRPGGDLIICGQSGDVIWKAAKREVLRFDGGMRALNTVLQDGDRLTLVGNGGDGSKFLVVSIDPASGKVLSKDESVHWGDWQDRLGFAPRWVGDLRVRTVPGRNGQSGIMGWKADGGEAFWIPTREEWRRGYLALVPLGRYAAAFCTDRDGWLRVQLVDPQAGKIEVESTIGASVAGRVMPQAAAGGIVVGTTRGLMSLVTVAGETASLPGRALGESHEAVWKMGKPLVVDGQTDEWEEQAGWELPAAQVLRGSWGGASPAEPVAAWAAWRDDAFATAVTLPVSPDRLGTTVLALDPVRGEFASDSRPFLLALDWQGGAPVARVANPLLADEPGRPAIQARAASDGTRTTWEVMIPWVWLYPGEERPGRDHWLRWGFAARLRQPDGAGLEVGAGLFDGIDKSVLTRLRLVDAKPAPDAKQPQRVIPRRGDKRVR